MEEASKTEIKPVETETDRKEEGKKETEACIKTEMEESDTTCKGVEEKIENEKILKQETETEKESEMVKKGGKEDTDTDAGKPETEHKEVESIVKSETECKEVEMNVKLVEATKESIEGSAKKTKPLAKAKVDQKQGVTGDNSSAIKSCVESEGVDGPKRSDVNSTVSKYNKVGEGRKKAKPKAKEKDGNGGKVESAESAKHVSIRFDPTTQNSD